MLEDEGEPERRDLVLIKTQSRCIDYLLVLMYGTPAVRLASPRIVPRFIYRKGSATMIMAGDYL
jgi:hypothetical protein